MQALLAADCRVRRRPGSVSPLRRQQLPSRCLSRPCGRQVAARCCTSCLCVGAALSIVRRRGGRRHCQACSRRGGADMMGPLARLCGFGRGCQVDAAVAHRLSTFWDLGVCLLVHSSVGVDGEQGREFDRLCTCSPVGTSRPPRCTDKIWSCSRPRFLYGSGVWPVQVMVDEVDASFGQPDWVACASFLVDCIPVFEGGKNIIVQR